jgi:hypothetical protein
MVDRIAIVKTGWSDWYQGEQVVGRFGYLNATTEGQQGHECYNFMPAPDGSYYGYLPPVGGGLLNRRKRLVGCLSLSRPIRAKAPLHLSDGMKMRRSPMDKRNDLSINHWSPSRLIH